MIKFVIRIIKQKEQPLSLLFVGKAVYYPDYQEIYAYTKENGMASKIEKQNGECR